MSFLQNIHIAEWILNLAFHSFCVMVAGYFCVRIFKQKAAPLRSSVFLMLLLALIFLPFLTLTFSSLGFMPVKTVLPITLDSAGIPTEISNDLNSKIHKDLEQPFSPEKKGFLGHIDSGRFLIAGINIFGIIWGFGCILSLRRFIIGAVSIGNLKKGLTRIDNQRIHHILCKSETVFKKNISPRVFESDAVKGPMVLGYFKPLILIPSGLLESLNDRELQSILIHELSHVFHRDQMSGFIQTLVIMFNWWNPVVHSLSTEVSRAREEIADNYVLFKYKSTEYAEFLVNLAERTLIIKPPRISIAMASPHVPLKERVKHILSKERNMETKLKKPTVCKILLMAALIFVILAGYRLTFTAEQSETLQEADQKKTDQAKTVKDPVRITGDLKPPKLIRRVDPVYPDAAKEKGIEGVVILELTTDIDGRVARIKVLRSIPGLDEAAKEAVKKWVYEPFIFDDEPRGAIFTITCRVSPSLPPVRAIDIKPPLLLKMVDPIYPDAAKEKGIEGVVILELTTDIYGRVARIKVLRSIPELDEAAKEAVKKWVYEPFILDGKPRGVIFTMTVRFVNK